MVSGQPPSHGFSSPQLYTGGLPLYLNALVVTAQQLYLLDIGQAEKADPLLRTYRHQVVGVHPTWCLHNDVLYKVTRVGEQLVPPTTMKEELLQLYHDSLGYLGVLRPLHRLSHCFWSSYI